ncbi:MAG: 4Fe-4S binding protein [Desulfosalsimonadaceae bacterium]|nr:4Fe-4S binding protein [Desulfosalsimonadaceae bacterium]
MKNRHLLWIRRFTQAFFLCLFVFLLVMAQLPQNVSTDYSQTFSLAQDTENLNTGNRTCETSGPPPSQDIRINWPVPLFFHMDPLVWLSSVISARDWIAGFGWAMGILLATLFFGRFFCGFICPFGTLHHMAGAVRPALKKKEMIAANRTTNNRRIKYFLLIIILSAAAVGINFAGLLDPISFLFRSLGLAALPAGGVGLHDLFEFLAASDVKLLNYLGYGGEALAAPVFGYENKVVQTGWIIGVLFLMVLFLNRIRPRFWCRTLCPLGALLGLCSRFTVLHLEKDSDKCTHCGRCTETCQGAATPEPGLTWQTDECLMCFNCTTGCPEDALTFRFKRPAARERRFDVGRRAILSGIAAGVSLPLLGRLDGSSDKSPSPSLIRPPGSLPEPEFLDRCQRCGLCMKVCPTNVIQPALSAAGMAGFWTPTLVMTLGYCEYTCTLCTSVCPTGAIAQLSMREKIETPIRIGSAFIDRGRCLPWNGNAPCIVCEEHCPTSPKAIYFKKDIITRQDGQTLPVQLPFVDLARCVGCGICENKCPVKGKPAIRTISAGESRSLENQILL